SLKTAFGGSQSNLQLCWRLLAPRAELASIGRRQHEQPNTDRHDCSSRRGGSDSTVTRTCRATGEALLVPARNRRSMVGRITGETGKSAEDERVAAGSVVCAGQRMSQEGSSPSGARMRSAVSKGGGNASPASGESRWK